MVCLGGLGPGGLDSQEFPHNERDVLLELSNYMSRKWVNDSL